MYKNSIFKGTGQEICTLLLFISNCSYVSVARDYKDKLASLVKEFRRSSGLNQREFAALADFRSHNTVSVIERGDYLDPPEQATLEKLARNIFGWELSQLVAYLSGEGEKPQKQESLPLSRLIIEIKSLKSLEEGLKLNEVLAQKLRELHGS